MQHVYLHKRPASSIHILASIVLEANQTANLLAVYACNSELRQILHSGPFDVNECILQHRWHALREARCKAAEGGVQSQESQGQHNRLGDSSALVTAV